MKLLKTIIIWVIFLILFFFASWSVINFFIPICGAVGFFEALRIFWESLFEGLMALFGA